MSRVQINRNDIKDSEIITSKVNSGAITRPKLSDLRTHQQVVPNNTVYVEAGTYVKPDSTGSVTFVGGSSPIFVPITVNPRIDLLCIDENGILSILTGGEAVSPIPPSYPTDRLTIAEVTITESVTVIVNDADIRDVRTFINLGIRHVSDQFRRYIYTATGGETLINLPFAYNLGNNSLEVYKNGSLKLITTDYTETSSTQVTFTAPLAPADVIQFCVIVAQPMTRYVQSFIASISETVNHNLGEFPIIVVIDNTNQVIIPNTITHNSIMQATVTFLLPQTGTIICLAGTQGRSDLVSQYIAGENINTFEVVYQSTTNDQVMKANATNITKIPSIGIAISAAPTTGNINILQVGLVSNSAWTWTAGDVIYVNTTDGQLTNVAPSGSGKVVQRVGIAKNATTVLFNFNTNYSVLS